MTPIAKNVSVVDEEGRQYEATYPKRAKGLVKHGRARFVDANTICLACPPSYGKGDESIMADKNIANTLAAEESGAGNGTAPEIKSGQEGAASAAKPALDMGYVLAQIEKVADQSGHISAALEQLGRMSDGENADGMSPGNIMGQAKAQSIADVVRCRETTNQQLLALYRKMYEDVLHQDDTFQERVLRLTERVWNNATLSLEEKQAYADTLDTIRHLPEV